MFFTQKVRAGNSILRIPKDMAWCFAGGEYYEKNVISWMNRIALGIKTPVLYDIGANYGYFSARLSAECKHVYAFEPVSKTYSVLCKNITRNKLPNVDAFHLGVGNSDGSLEINLYSSSGNNSIYKRSLPPNHPLKPIGCETIRLVRLDEFAKCNSLLPPDIIKIDVEGAELYALQGARELISKCHPFIFMEYSDTTSNDAGYEKEMLLSELLGHGYVIMGLAEDVEDMTLVPLNDFSKVPIANIIAVPAGETLSAW